MSEDIEDEKNLHLRHQDRVNEHFEEQSDYWRDIYGQSNTYAAVHRFRRMLVLEWTDKLGFPPGIRVLEVGCGAGLTTAALAERGYSVTAVDSVEAMLAETRRSVSRAGMAERVTIARGDTQKLMMKDNTFSLVVAMGVVPWLPSPGMALQEMARVLKPGGYLIVNSDNRWRLNYALDPWRFPLLMPVRRKVRKALEQARLLKTSNGGRLSQAHTLREFDALLADAKLVNERRMTFGFGPFTFLNWPLFPDSAGIKIHEGLQQLADRQFPLLRSGGSQYLVQARKIRAEFENIHRNWQGG